MAQNHLVGHSGVIGSTDLQHKNAPDWYNIYDRYYVTNGVQIDMQTSMVVNR